MDVRIISRNLQSDAINARACGNIKRLVIAPAPRNIAYPLRNVERPEMLAFGRENPNPARTRAIQVSLFVHLLAVGRSWPGIGCRVKENLSVRERAISLAPCSASTASSAPSCLRRDTFHPEKSNSVGARQVFYHQL